MIRTRYAPSPTGKPHVGNIRTAIFEYLYAKSQKGEFILRIEDTDRERFVQGAVEYIEESLDWLGIKWDNEKIIHQSERLDIYKKYAEQLVAEGYAYKCFCTKERLEKLREEQTKAKRPPGYDGCCRKLTKEDIEKLEKRGETSVLRFKIPKAPKEVTWEDEIRGKVSIRTDIQEDFIIQKSDGYPTYNFANVIDDHKMGITNVIRGEEFIPSTPKHILLYMAFGWTPPKFAHIPHIIGKDRSKLSKRHGDTAIMDYKEKGYLADTMLNFLALLGWNPGTTQEIFSREELEKKFDLKRVGKSPAVFDIEKLNWINGEKIRAMKVEDLVKEIEEFTAGMVETPGVKDSKTPSVRPTAKLMKKKDPNLLKRAVTVLQTRMVTLRDFTENSGYFFEMPKYDPKLLIFKKSNKDLAIAGLKGVLNALSSSACPAKPWRSGVIPAPTSVIPAEAGIQKYNEMLTSVVGSENLSNGDVFWPVRAALSGQEKSPSPGEMLWALGKEESVKRIREAIKKLS